MLNERSQTYRPETGGPAQTPDESVMMDEDYNPTDLAGDVDSGPDGIGVASGSPNMELDTEHLGNGDTSAITMVRNLILKQVTQCQVNKSKLVSNANGRNDYGSFRPLAFVA